MEIRGPEWPGKIIPIPKPYNPKDRNPEEDLVFPEDEEKREEGAESAETGASMDRVSFSPEGLAAARRSKEETEKKE